MKLDLSKIIKERTYEFKGLKLSIRPFPRSKGKFTMRDGSVVFSGAESLETFIYCLTSCEPGVEADGKPVPLTDEVKQAIFDANLEGLGDFVIQKNTEIFLEMAAQEKN